MQITIGDIITILVIIVQSIIQISVIFTKVGKLIGRREQELKNVQDALSKQSTELEDIKCELKKGSDRFDNIENFIKGIVGCLSIHDKDLKGCIENWRIAINSRSQQ